MKPCPFCQVDNQDDAQTCRFCGRPMNPPLVSWDSAPQTDSPEPTQPVHPGGAARPSPNAAQTLPPVPPAGSGQPPAGGMPAFDPNNTLPVPGNIPQGPRRVGAARTYNSPGYGASSYGTSGPRPRPAASPGAQPASGYGNTAAQPPYPPRLSQPAVQPPPELERDSSRRWQILLGVLGVLLLCMGGLAVWMFTSTAAGGFNRAGADLATQAAGLFGGASPDNTPFPTATLLAPSPWPTFTPEPTQEPAPTNPPEANPTAEATQDAGLERYLSPECSAALDNLESLSKAVTENPGLPLDGAWRDNLSQSVKTVREQCGSLDQASPVPGQMAEAQQNLDQATQEFDEANRLFKEGVEGLDAGKVLEAGKHLAEATKYLNQALDALQKIGN